MKGVRMLMEKFDRATDISSDSWTLKSASKLAVRLNFPAQPIDNCTDCGVLVCIYILLILTNNAWPMEERRRRVQDPTNNSSARFSSQMRALIGSQITLSGTLSC